MHLLSAAAKAQSCSQCLVGASIAGYALKLKLKLKPTLQNDVPSVQAKPDPSCSPKLLSSGRTVCLDKSQAGKASTTAHKTPGHVRTPIWPSAVACRACWEDSAAREWLKYRRSSRAAMPPRSAACSAPPAFISCRSTAQHTTRFRQARAGWVVHLHSRRGSPSGVRSSRQQVSDNSLEGLSSDWGAHVMKLDCF